METKPQKNLEQRLVLRQDWLESERDWGVRPDGCSLHESKEDRRDYIRQYWEKMPAHPPQEYERPDGKPYHISMPKKIYEELAKSSCGIRLYAGSTSRLEHENRKS